MKMPAYLVVGTITWMLFSMLVVPRFVRSLFAVAIIALVSGSALTWARYRVFDDPWEIKAGIVWVLLTTIIAMLFAMLLARREERLQRRRDRQGRLAPLLTDPEP